MFNKSLILACVLSLTLAGCTSFKRVTGQTNDTVLPGARESVLAPDQTTARDPMVTGNQPGTGGAPQQAQPGDLLPGDGKTVACDPLVEMCPGMEPKPSQTGLAKAPPVKDLT